MYDLVRISRIIRILIKLNYFVTFYFVYNASDS